MHVYTSANVATIKKAAAIEEAHRKSRAKRVDAKNVFFLYRRSELYFYELY